MSQKFLNENGIKQILQTLKGKFVLADNGQKIKIDNTTYTFPFDNGVEIEGSNIDISVSNNKLLFSANGQLEYLIKADTDAINYQAIYRLYKKENGVTSAVEDSVINIPYDYVIKNVTIETCNTLNTPVNGYQIGDKYLNFVINTKNNDVTDEHLYVNLQELVSAYTAGAGIDITNNVISVKLDLNSGLAIDEDNNITLNVATANKQGAMSSIDKIKLDEIGSLTNNDIDSIFTAQEEQQNAQQEE